MLLIIHLGIPEPKPGPKSSLRFAIRRRIGDINLTVNQEGGGTVSPFHEQTEIIGTRVAAVKLEDMISQTLSESTNTRCQSNRSTCQASDSSPALALVADLQPE
ncbi:MAG: hypothetical protein CL419_11585 [Acidimicrobiaceae bacterium]|nr:hypothetical protein [Acidimicrobiaceae bacterium]